MNAEQQLLCQFSANSATIYAQWVQEMAIDQANAAASVAMLGEKYADVVRVVDVPSVDAALRRPRWSAAAAVVVVVAAQTWTRPVVGAFL